MCNFFNTRLKTAFLLRNFLILVIISTFISLPLFAFEDDDDRPLAERLKECPECLSLAEKSDKAAKEGLKFSNSYFGGKIGDMRTIIMEDIKKLDEGHVHPDKVIKSYEEEINENIESRKKCLELGDKVKAAARTARIKKAEEGIQWNRKNYKREVQEYLKTGKKIKELKQKVKKYDDKLKQLLKKSDELHDKVEDCLDDCEDKKEGKSIKQKYKGYDDTNLPWKFFMDDSSWCSYWIWETPTPKRKPKGKIPVEIPRKGPGKKPRSPKEKPGRPTVFYSEAPGTSEKTPEKVPTKKPEEKPKEEVPEKVPEKEPFGPQEFIVKAKRDVLKGDKVVTESVASAQIKLSFLEPDLPVGDAKKNIKDGSFNDPASGVTNKDGELIIKHQGSVLSYNGTDQKITTLSGLAQLWEGISLGTTPVYADPVRPEGSRNPIIVEVNIPRFESSVLKINIDKSKKNWDDPATYLGRILGDFVTRKWIVEKDNCLYAVVNIPVTKEGAK